MPDTIGTPENSPDEIVHVRGPHDITATVPVEQLVTWWGQAGQRAFRARFGGTEPDAADYWTELALGTRIAREVTSGQWTVIAQLLRHGAVRDWEQIGHALGTTAADAAIGFAHWINSQETLFHGTGLGLSGAEAEELTRLADAVRGAGR